ncbi:MAG: HAD-IA family hydrolase [Ancalomicrobiaceae bacterium]|nr:HAD-IA family hydrolase [Ancalomicrobiaceae bacterium]
MIVNPLREKGIHIGREFAAFLFDMDGTILTSIAVAERIWTDWAVRHGLDVAAFLPTIHGVRAFDTIARLGLPGVDPLAEAELITRAEIDLVDGIDAIPGAAALLASLPADRWAVVTSAPRALALRRIAAAGLPVPPMLVAGEDVANGKPAPDCYLLAAARLGVAAADCLVFEDAPAGVEAAEAAGASVVIITACSPHRPTDRHPSVATFDALRVELNGGGRLPLTLV